MPVTLHKFHEILTSKPRRRVAMLAILWVCAALLKFVKAIAYLPALPYLRAADALYEVGRKTATTVGAIWDEREIRELQNESEDDEWKL